MIPEVAVTLDHIRMVEAFQKGDLVQYVSLSSELCKLALLKDAQLSILLPSNLKNLWDVLAMMARKQREQEGSVGIIHCQPMQKNQNRWRFL